MTQIISMPKDRYGVRNQTDIFNAIGASFFITGQSNNMDEFVDYMKNAKDQPDIMIFDYSWADVYKFVLHNDFKDHTEIRTTPTIFIHGNPNWVSGSLVKKFREQFNFVGFLTTKDQSPDYKNSDPKTGELLEPQMQVLLRALIEHKKKHPGSHISY